MHKQNNLLSFIDSLTMYKVILFSLLFLFISSLIASNFGYINFTPASILISVIAVASFTISTNYILSKFYKVIPNPESAIITSLILFFLFSPASNMHEFYTLAIAGTIASASKYLVNINKIHIFNPAAFAAVITPLIGFDGAVWWIATPALIPSTLIVVIYLIRKLRRTELALNYFGGLLFGLLVSKQLTQSNFQTLLPEIFLSWPNLFFVGIMLTEPFTMPNKNKLINIFGLLMGFASTIQYHFGPIFSTPELNLIIGNLFAFSISNKRRYILKLTSKKMVADHTHLLTFQSTPAMNYQPGQYLEWSLPHTQADIRGIRRYFTISSSPTEKDIKLVFKTFAKSSSFKNALTDFETGDKIIATNIAGDFTPDKTQDKFVFIAGGIGITPFRSIIKYYLDKNIKKNIHLLYVCTNKNDFAFKKLFQKAREQIGLKTQYFVSCENQKITTNTIESIQNYQSYTYFISGPDAMVKHYKKLLKSLGIKNIKTDYFPGF